MEDVHVPCKAVWCVPNSPLPNEIRLEIMPLEDTDVLYLTVMTTDHVVLGSAKAISDVTDKRAKVYSDRVRFPATFVPIWANDMVSARLSYA